MPSNAISKADTIAAIREIYEAKSNLCLLSNSVQSDLDNSLVSPSSQTVTLAQNMFNDISFSNYLGLGINNLSAPYKAVVSSTTNVTTYGMVFATCGVSSILTYTITKLVGGTLSLALLLDSTNLTIYAGVGPTVIQALDDIISHYCRVLSYLRSKCDILPLELNDIVDVDYTGTVDECQVLAFSNCKWTNKDILINSGIIKDTCVNTATLADGDALIWNATGQCWTNSSGPSTDIQQVSHPNSAVDLTESLTIGAAYKPILSVGATPPDFGVFQLTTNIPPSFIAGYLLNWTGVVDSVDTGVTTLQMRISANDPSMTVDVATLQTNTETELDLNNSESSKILSINYVVPIVPNGTTFYVEWRVIGDVGLKSPIIKSGTFVFFSVALPPP